MGTYKGKLEGTLSLNQRNTNIQYTVYLGTLNY